MIVPMLRGLAESLEPRQLPIAADTAIAESHQQWLASRVAHNKELSVPGSPAAQRKWERHYLRGVTTDGTPAPTHQTKLQLSEVIQDGA